MCPHLPIQPSQQGGVSVLTFTARRIPTYSLHYQSGATLLFKGFKVEVRIGFKGLVVGVRYGVLYYVHKSPHKDRNVRMCLCVTPDMSLCLRMASLIMS